MNEFFLWNLRHNKPWDVQPRLNDAEHDELFELMADPSLPDDAMSAEMADGYMTACLVGPMRLAVHQWMETIFAQPTLPLPHDSQRQQRLLHLLLRRYADIDASTSLDADQTTTDNIFMPLSAQVADEDRITPCRLDEQRERIGFWNLKDWAEGFRRAVADDEAWDPLVTSPDAGHLLSPLVLYEMGHNPDRPDFQVDDNPDLFPWLIVSVCAMRNWWRTYNRAPAVAAAPTLRNASKVGRNDPCPCGSGKKYKKCCGA